MARPVHSPPGMQGFGRRFVYVLRSDVDPNRHCVGLTSDVDTRLERHNHGPCGHTVEHRPWSLVVVVEFPDERQALRFERYLKSGSGRAFARRHFGPALGPFRDSLASHSPQATV